MSRIGRLALGGEKDGGEVFLSGEWRSYVNCYDVSEVEDNSSATRVDVDSPSFVLTPESSAARYKFADVSLVAFEEFDADRFQIPGIVDGMKDESIELSSESRIHGCDIPLSRYQPRGVEQVITLVSSVREELEILR